MTVSLGIRNVSTHLKYDEVAPALGTEISAQFGNMHAAERRSGKPVVSRLAKVHPGVDVPAASITDKPFLVTADGIAAGS